VAPGEGRDRGQHREAVQPGWRRLTEPRLREVEFRLDELQLVDSTVERIDDETSHVVTKDASARLLDTLPGVAPCTALFLSAIGDINRFPDSKHFSGRCVQSTTTE